jgi:hypothetical protein
VGKHGEDDIDELSWSAMASARSIEDCQNSASRRTAGHAVARVCWRQELEAAHPWARMPPSKRTNGHS